MHSMTEEQWKSFLNLIRSYAKLRADFGILCGILAKAEISNTPVHDWVAEARRLRASASYVAEIQATEALISQVEKMNPADDLSGVLSKIPPPEFLN